MNDKEFLSQSINDLEASVRFYAAGNDKEREHIVAESFIENLRLQYDKSEITSSSDDPPDIIFRGARFEIKEVLDAGRRRHDEYKKELKRARSLTDPKELFQFFKPKDITIGDIYQHCECVISCYDKHYSDSVMAKLDLLIYVNLLHVVNVIEFPFPDTTTMSKSGWRSVSFVKGQRSCCFCARDDAPLFLRQAVGCITHLYPQHDGGN